MQKLVVLGATGTVGRNTLDVAQRHPDRLQVFALTAAQDVEGMLSLCETHRPRHVAMLDGQAAEALRGRLQAAGIPTEVHAGMDAIAQLAAHADVDQVMSAIVGAAGLVPTLAAVRAGKRVLIANKEPLVMAGSLLLAEVQRHAATLIPIDSEHNAIFQCLPADSRCGEVPRGVRRLILTASGGAFREWSADALSTVTPAQAVRHPNWVMGPKISVDSATMMNKGLELIEAAHLYQLGADALSVVIHPESVVHSVVEYLDGSMLAQMGASDMRVPIAHALAWPQRWVSGVDGLDLAALGQLRFEAVNPGRFPCLDLAQQALRQGGHAPNVLNAANEVAVAAFLGGRLGFTAIAPLIEGVLARMGSENFGADDELASILGVDAWARRSATEALQDA